MATTTTNYALVKPDYADAEDVAVINDNMDSIDTILKTNADGVAANTADITTLETLTTESADWVNITPGGFFTSGTLQYKRVGQVVFVRVSGSVNTTAGNPKAICAAGAIPAQFQPALAAVSGARFGVSGTPSVTGWISVDADGQIQVCQNQDTCDTVGATLSYPYVP